MRRVYKKERERANKAKSNYVWKNVIVEDRYSSFVLPVLVKKRKARRQER